MYRVRDKETPFNLGGGFRDELVATAMALSLVVVGSFVVTEMLVGGKKQPQAEPLTENNPQTLGVTDSAPEKINLLPSPTPKLEVAAVTVVEEASDSAERKTATEGAVVAPVVPFGEDGFYDFSSYSIAFKNPRVEFDASKSTARKLVVEIELTNKTVLEGLETRVFASIVKDGIVIVPKAAMHVPSKKTIATNQQAVFLASMTLVEATDVRELRYEPGGDLPSASHFLYQ